MAADEIILTPQGKRELEKELERREHETRAEINEQLRVARGFGDFSENAELDAAREAQSQNESRINDIIQILAVAKVVDNAFAGEYGRVVGVNTAVEVEDERGKHLTFSLVGTTETDSLANRISNESPMGAALMGHAVGDEISFTTPSGKVRTYKVLDIQLAGTGESDE